MLSHEKLQSLINKFPDACHNFLTYWESLQKEYDSLPWWRRLFKDNPHYLEDEHNKYSRIYSQLRYIQCCLDSCSTFILREPDLELVNYWSEYYV